MNRILSLLSALLFSIPAVADEAKDPQVQYRVSYNSNYLAFGAGIELWDQPCVQGDISWFWKNGVYLFLWGSTDLEGRPGSSLADEYDLGLGWAGVVKGWNVDIGVTYFDEPHLGKVARLGEEDILYTRLKIGHSIGRNWTMSGTFENYATMHNTGYSGGNLYGLELAKTFSISKKVSVPFSVATIYDDGGFGFDDGVFIRGSLGADITLTKTLTLNAGGRYYLPVGVNDARKNDVMSFIGLTWKP